jgi:hypothetical protein
MGFINIGYNTLLANHPSMTDEFKTMINGSIKKFHDEPGHKNTCASKISWAFNHVDGHYINCDGDYGKGGVLVKKVRFLIDDDGWEYIFSTLDLRQYLNNRYGAGQMFPNTSKIGSRNGVIIFEPTDTSTIGHTDIWVNGQIHDADLYFGSWYSAVTNDRVFFWDLNS